MKQLYKISKCDPQKKIGLFYVLREKQCLLHISLVTKKQLHHKNIRFTSSDVTRILQLQDLCQKWTSGESYSILIDLSLDPFVAAF